MDQATTTIHARFARTSTTARPVRLLEVSDVTSAGAASSRQRHCPEGSSCGLAGEFGDIVGHYRALLTLGGDGGDFTGWCRTVWSWRGAPQGHRGGLDNDADGWQ
jgi:hypothetical protein